MRAGAVELELLRGDSAVFGRGEDVDLRVAEPDDTAVSRRAGSLSFADFGWQVSNTGRRSFYVVEAGAEIELRPNAGDRSVHRVLHQGAWIRVPRSGSDAAIQLEIPPDERPVPEAIRAPTAGGPPRTQVEPDISLTDNELRSVVAVYQAYLELPPRYRREPNSYRAAARRIGAEEGKVKADLRRVQEKVARAGGPDVGGSRGRDALIAWLASREVVARSDLGLLD